MSWFSVAIWTVFVYVLRFSILSNWRLCDCPSAVEKVAIQTLSKKKRKEKKKKKTHPGQL